LIQDDFILNLYEYINVNMIEFTI